ncbi:hypothetical protein T265_00414 [Opisthorchis viverrini]|uniref:Uncharacterized protein n=1 Tax=Opisthorchis viverrini TaxID=6198 RepID=A0A075A307_OPIVI|nr:hypothetical protein T265_00414 [Opisthorchis viverrini]KER33726.1 hypothetical protein T265_00414 [Opisthorchis viverrini]
MFLPIDESHQTSASALIPLIASGPHGSEELRPHQKCSVQCGLVRNHIFPALEGKMKTEEQKIVYGDRLTELEQSPAGCGKAAPAYAEAR